MPVRARQLYHRALPWGIVDLVRQLALMGAAYYLYRVVRGMADNGTGAAEAFQNARDLITVEQTLNFFVEPAVQAWAESLPLVVEASSWVYINAQTTVTLGALAYLYLCHNRSFYFVRNMFAVAWIIALVGYTAYPTAPPRFFPEWGFVDAVSDTAGVDRNNSVNALFNPYAAVPSMHVCFALLIGVPLARLARHGAVRAFWAGYPVLVTFVIVATANHWILDAVLGACTAAVAAVVARSLGRARPAAWTFTPHPGRLGAGGSLTPGHPAT